MPAWADAFGGPGAWAADAGDHAARARRLGVSTEAVALLADGDVVDLHVESFLWPRLLHQDLTRWHERPVTGGRLWGQADLPRLAAVGVTGAAMSIATNPVRTQAGRRRALLANVARLRATLAGAGWAVAGDVGAYRRARAAGLPVAFPAVQGGHALVPADLDRPELAELVRVTLVHLTRSVLGASSAPGGRGGGRGLTAAGAAMVEALRAHRVLLDLSHAARETFWAALDVHGTGPVAVTHTGLDAVRASWRNLDDDQVRAVAARGGVVGVIHHGGFLARPGWRARAGDVVAHLAHLIDVGGEDVAALGTDTDGFVLPPRDLPTVLALPRLVQAMLDARFPAERIRAVLGTNALRCMAAVRAPSR